MFSIVWLLDAYKMQEREYATLAKLRLRKLKYVAWNKITSQPS